jgi:hypothetical protein
MGSSSSLARGLYTDLEAGVRLASTHEVSMHVVAIYVKELDNFQIKSIIKSRI